MASAWLIFLNRACKIKSFELLSCIVAMKAIGEILKWPISVKFRPSVSLPQRSCGSLLPRNLHKARSSAGLEQNTRYSLRLFPGSSYPPTQTAWNFNAAEFWMALEPKSPFFKPVAFLLDVLHAMLSHHELLLEIFGFASLLLKLVGAKC